MPIDETVAIARQVAEALEAAHDRGIIHRDLKPANIKMTPEGVVKVLDFGLAKAVTESSATPPREAPTLTRHDTQLGVVMGTAAYMSPEQARGQTVDKRADIWAFGSVLFEMCAARPPFAGATVSDTLAAVIGREPDWTRLPAGTPAHLIRLMRRSLTEDPKLRLRDIGEARIALAADAETLTAPTAPTRGRLSTLATAAAVLLLVAGAFAFGPHAWAGEPFPGHFTSALSGSATRGRCVLGGAVAKCPGPVPGWFAAGVRRGRQSRPRVAAGNDGARRAACPGNRGRVGGVLVP